MIAFSKTITASIIDMVFMSLPNKISTYQVHLRHDVQQLSLFCLTEALLTVQCLEPLL